jgi:hypothetical protein
MSLSILACYSAPSCGTFCPVAPGQNNNLDLVVDVHYCDGRNRTYRLGYNGCTYSLVADPNKGESCLLCGYGVRRLPFFSFFPSSSVYLPSPPASFTFSLAPGAELYLDSTYGTPVVLYKNEYGNPVGAGTVTAVASDGTWLEAAPPDLSQGYSGNYTVEISNRYWDGQLQTVGLASMYAYGRDRPDTDGDGWYDDEDCYPFDSTRWDCFDPGGGCGGGGGIQQPCYEY